MDTASKRTSLIEGKSIKEDAKQEGENAPNSKNV